MKYSAFLLCVITNVVLAQARFDVEGGLERKFGKVPLTDIHDTVTILNPGTAPLYIISINPTCGCTAAMIDTSIVPAGGKAHVYVKIEPPDMMGHIHKTIEFLTNDLRQPKQVVGFGFEIIRDIGATPRQYAFAGCKVDTPCEMGVMVYNVSEAPVSLIRDPITMPGLKSLMPDSLTLAPHDSISYKLQLNTSETGLTRGTFRMHTTSQINPTFEFSVFANVADKNGMPVMPRPR